MEYVALGISITNLFLLIGIAGSLAKMIRYVQQSESSKNNWEKLLKNKQSGSTTRQPDYTDTDRSPNWDGIPVSKNWDGVPAKK